MYLCTKKVSDWKQINYRNVDSMLSVQFIYDLYDQYSSTINWFRFKNVCLYYQDNKLWSYTPKNEWEDALNTIAKQFKNPKESSNPDIIKNCYWYYNRKEKLLDRFLKKTSKIDLKKLSNKELYKLLFNWYQITLNQIYFINLAPVELGLQRAIKELECDKYLTHDEISILYSLDDNTAVIKEEYEFLKKVYESTDDIETIIDKHLNEFSYITIGYGSKPMSKEFLYDRYNKIKKTNKDIIKKRIESIENYPISIKEQKDIVYKKLNNEKLAELFDLAAKLGFMRDRKKAYLGKSVQYRNKILDEISIKTDVKIEDIKYYTMDEFKDLLIDNDKLSIEEIEKRREGIYISNISNLYSGETARENYFSSVKTEKEDINILKSKKGICASPGIIRAKARVCLTFEDSNKLENGEILVTYGTDFDFMNAIVKSSGIITEEGGILSHASVISRELKKPCIIAFKGITKVLHTGDIIEINAEEGTVTLLKEVSKKEKNKDKIVGFYNIATKSNANEIGNKAYNLSELYKLKCNVPEAYFLGVSFFETILKIQNKYDEYIRFSDDLYNFKDKIYDIIDNIEIPKEIFKYLNFETNTYAVRSSSPNEDGEDKSFAGQYVTELFCSNEENTIKGIKKCWKSLLGAGLEKYQGKNTNTRFGGIVLQKMVTAEYAGVMFTKDPVSNNKECMIIEACKGVASKLVDNRVVPDRYFINQNTLEIIDSITKNNIPDEIIKELAKIGKNLEKHYNCEVDIEWAVENNCIYIIQCRPITT